MESVSFNLKYWLKLIYPVVARCHDLGHDGTQYCGMTSCVKWSADNYTVNFSDIGTAHCSRTVSFPLAKHFFTIAFTNVHGSS